MNARRITAAAAVLAASACLGGCIATAPPPLLRYFRPLLPEANAADTDAAEPKAADTDAAETDAAETPASAGLAGGPPLQLGRITAAEHLREPMVWRLSEVEVAFDELHRWVAPPVELTADALARVLYKQAGLRHGGPTSATLDLHLRAFERDRHRAIVVLSATLRPPEGPPRHTDVRSTHPIEGDGPEAFAAAMGPALLEAARAVARFAAASGEASESQ